MRIDLAIMFAWRQIAKMRNSVSTNLLIMDEVLDRSLDTQGTDDFMGIIKQLVDTQNTIIISHNQQVIDQFDHKIKAQIVGNFTQFKVIDGTATE